MLLDHVKRNAFYFMFCPHTIRYLKREIIIWFKCIKYYITYRKCFRIKINVYILLHNHPSVQKVFFDRMTECHFFYLNLDYFLQSTGDSLDDEDDEDLMEAKKNTSYNEVIDADNPQTPAEVSKHVIYSYWYSYYRCMYKPYSPCISWKVHVYNAYMLGEMKI